MPKKYGNPEKAALIVLMLENREMLNSELRNDWGIELGKDGRTLLNKDGLIISQDEKRPFTHKITQAGIDWCETRLVDLEAPPRSGPLSRAVFPLSRIFAVYFRRHRISLAEVVHPSALEADIHRAYRELSSKPQQWVRLADLRPKLDGAERDAVDQLLEEMTRTGLVHLSPESDRKAITEADRAAAIRIGGQDNHLLAIEDS